MAKPWAKPFYNSKRWKQCRDSYIARRTSIDGGLCERCRDTLGYIVHHKTTLTPVNINDPSASLNHALLSYECRACHDKNEGHGTGSVAGALLVVFNANGEPICKVE